MDNEQIIILTVLAGSLFAFLWIVVIILFVVVYQRKSMQKEKEHTLILKNKELELLKAVIETQEAERQKIARNLHDEINPLLATIKLGISSQQRVLNKQGIEPDGLDFQKELVNTVIENLQSATRDLSPRILYKYGLVKALNNFIQSIPEISFIYEKDVIDEVTIDESKALNIYRIFLELIQNLRKHEQITEGHIKIIINLEKVVLSIKHNGKGISNAEFVKLADESNGIGLNSLKSRLILIGGQLDYQNEEQAEINLTVPLRNAKEN